MYTFQEADFNKCFQAEISGYNQLGYNRGIRRGLAYKLVEIEKYFVNACNFFLLPKQTLEFF